MTALRQTSDTNDIYLDDGTHQLAIASDTQAYSYIIADAVRTLKGELQFDVNAGIDYMNTVFRSSSRLNIWKMYVTRKIMSFDFVKSIKNFDVKFTEDGKNILYTISVDTTYGDISVMSNDPTRKDGGGMMSNLVQDGIFYLPVYLENGIQVYRQLKQYIDPMYPDDPVSTQVSDTLYVKNSAGEFVIKENQ